MNDFGGDECRHQLIDICLTVLYLDLVLCLRGQKQSEQCTGRDMK